MVALKHTQNLHSLHNYSYDKIGNLVADKSEEIEEISWTMQGKVKEIRRIAGSQKPDLVFNYDGLGNRVSKTVIPKNSVNNEDSITTYYVRDAQGNILATYEKTKYKNGDEKFYLKEQYLYGSSRIGMNTSNLLLASNINGNVEIKEYDGYFTKTVGNKRFELTNHLGNVLAVVSDKKCADNEPDVVSVSDYYPFGMTLPGRSFNANSYRHGYNTQEKTDEVAGTGNHYTAQYWEYNPQVVQRWNMDPVTYPWQSPYVINNNNPIVFTDLLGLFGSRKEANEYKKAHKLKGRVRLNQDGSYSIDNRKEYSSIFRDEEYGVMKGILVEGKRKDNKTLTPWELGVEWLSGTGAKSREFSTGDNITEMYKSHKHVDLTRRMVINQLSQSEGQNTKEGSNPYALKGVKGVGKYIKDYSTLATAGLTGNLIYTYLGSHSLQYVITSVDIEARTAIVTFTVHNTSTMQSATRPPVIGYQEWYKNSVGKYTNEIFKSGAGSETEQWIEWTETIRW